MAVPFQTADVGQALMLAEHIKGQRRQAETDKLRDQYLGVQTQNAQQQGVFAANADQRAQQDQKYEQQTREAKAHYLIADNIERSDKPLEFVQQFAPDFIESYDAKHGAGSFAQLPPEQIKKEAGMMKQHFASQAGISLNGTPEQQFAANQANAMDDKNFSQAKELAGINQGYDLAKIDRQGRYSQEKAAATGQRQEFKNVQNLRKEFEGMDAVKHYKAVLPLIERARTAPNNRAGDVSVVYALGKMFDPTSAVKEGEIQLSKDTATWVQKLVGEANSQLTGKGSLNPETRKGIMEALQGQVDAFAQPYEQERQRFAQYAKENGWDESQVVGAQRPADAFGGGQGSPQQLTPEQAAQLPPGTRFLGMDGVERVKH